MIDRYKTMSVPSVSQSLVGLQDALLWFLETLQRVRCELKADPGALQLLATLEDYPIDLLQRLDAIEQEVRHFRCSLQSSHWSMSLTARASALQDRSNGLLDGDADRLQYQNEQFEKIASQIEEAASQIASDLDERLTDSTDRLWDYEMDATVNFILRESDAGHSQDSDNRLGSLDLTIHEIDGQPGKWVLPGSDWPEGTVFYPIPHGRLFHALGRDSDDFAKFPPLSMPDILRIGEAWVDVVVRYQFYFDVDQSRWVKGLSWPDEGPRMKALVHEGAPT